MNRRTYRPAVRYGEECEHCDGASSMMFRVDHLRGHVCRYCDESLDAFDAEPDLDAIPDDQAQPASD